MKVIFILFLSLIVTACGGSGGGGSSSNESQFTYTIPPAEQLSDECKAEKPLTSDIKTESEVMIYYSRNGRKMYVTPDDIERFYTEVQACMGITWKIYSPNTPQVLFLNFGEDPTPGLTVNPTDKAMYVNLGHYVVVNSAKSPRNCKTDEEALRHEFVHHFLEVTGATYAENHDHLSPFFSQCAKVSTQQD